MIDAPQRSAQQLRDPRAALSGGDLQTDNIIALERFDRAFAFRPEALERARARFEHDTGRSSVQVSEATPFVFRYLLEESFTGGDAVAETIHFYIVGAGEFTVAFDHEALDVSAGRAGAATARIVTSRETFNGMTMFKVMATSAAAARVRAAATAGIGRELEDYQLASIAGGKGSHASCFADSGGDSGCGGEILVVGCHIDGDFCAGDGCWSDGGCYINACAGAACFGDSCGLVGCAADGCGLDTCGGAACGEAGCGEAACLADACYTALCGGDACLADACLAAACLLDVAPWDACGVDACLVNVLPGVPFV